jgi:hypothetical protein
LEALHIVVGHFIKGNWPIFEREKRNKTKQRALTLNSRQGERKKVNVYLNFPPKPIIFEFPAEKKPLAGNSKHRK